MKLLTSDYPATGGNKTPALDDIWDDIKADGGTIDFNEQLVELHGRTTFYGGITQNNLALVGDLSSEIRLNTPDSEVAMNFGDKGFLNLEGLVFTGDGGGDGIDCGVVLIASNCIRTLIAKCFFLGIGADKILDILSGSNLVLKDSVLSGNSATVVKIDGAYSFWAEHCDFLDYFVFQNQYHSKTGGGASWISAVNPPGGVLGANKTSIVVKNCRLDEGAGTAIYVDGYDKVDIEHVKINISSAGFGKGIHVRNCKNVRIVFCHVGYNNNATGVLVKVEHCESVTIIGLTKDQELLTRVETDGYSAENVKLIYCDPAIVPHEV